MIEKPSKQMLKTVSSLKHKKYRKLEKLSTVEGYKLIGEALDAGAPLKFAFFTAKAVEEHADLVKDCLIKEIPVYSVSPAEMERLSPLKTPPGCLAVYSTEFEIPLREGEVVLCIHKISEPGNLGTILRTAEWFGVSQVFLASESAELHNPATVRGSMGAVFRLAVKEDADLAVEIAKFKADGRRILSAETRGGGRVESVPGLKVLALGDELGNLPDEIRDLVEVRYTIPQGVGGGGESLNIAVACGIILHEISKLNS